MGRETDKAQLDTKEEPTVMERTLSALVIIFAVLIVIFSIILAMQLFEQKELTERAVCPSCHKETSEDYCESCDENTVHLSDLIVCQDCNYYILGDFCTNCELEY